MRRDARLPWPLCLGIGVAAALVGLAPWLVVGARLPLQNLWDGTTPPDPAPVALLPFSQYAIFLLLGLIATGHAAAGIAMRGLRARATRAGRWAAWAGVLAVQTAATVQTTLVVASGLQDRPESALYLAAVVSVIVVSALVGTLVYWLVASAPAAGAMIGLAIAAVCAGSWFSGFLTPLGGVPSEAASWLGSYVFRWVPAVLVGAAIAWVGCAARAAWSQPSSRS